MSSERQQQTATDASAYQGVEEEYLRAQRAAVESIQVGRATLEQVHQQGEQLDRADALAGESSYQLDKAGRLLRGMTWSGWIANALSKNVVAPDSARDTPGHRHGSSSHRLPSVYENVPEFCRPAAQAIQNLHANVNVLEMSETDEQRETLVLICRTMYEAAQTELDALRKSHSTATGYTNEFQSHLKILHERIQSVVRRQKPNSQRQNNPNQKQGLFGNTPSDATTSDTFSSTTAQLNHVHPRRKAQDDHLDQIAEHLGELGALSQTLSSAMSHQTELIDSLDDKADTITEKSKMVTRRADRILQTKTWTPVKPTFQCRVSLRHLASGRYLSVQEGKLVLQPSFHPQTSAFSMYSRQGLIFGLKNLHTGRWLGQSLLGALSTSASSFGRREEWEADDDWNSTKLLCASVGWGAGGYLMVQPTGDKNNFALKLGSSDIEHRKKVDHWCIRDLAKTNDDI